MKAIRIGSPIKDFAGNDVMGVDGPLITKSILLQCIGSFFTSSNASENIQAMDIGRALYKAETVLNLENADFKLLKKAVDKTIQDQRYTAIVVSHIIEVMDSAIDVETADPSKE